jgi:hypothetical protein
MCILRELYGIGAERLRNETMTFTTPSNKKVEIMTVSSNYHMECELIHLITAILNATCSFFW